MLSAQTGGDSTLISGTSRTHLGTTGWSPQEMLVTRRDARSAA
jgi:hypothetical protein